MMRACCLLNWSRHPLVTLLLVDHEIVTHDTGIDEYYRLLE
jgi:hypothetical protein